MTRGRSARISVAVCLAAVALASLAELAHGQLPGGPEPPGADVHARDFDYLSVNALVGGLTAGLTSRLRGGRFAVPFLQGMLGGGISYAGKRLSAKGFGGAGLLGRQVAAVGGSMVRSAAYGSGVLDTLLLPLGPGRLHVPLDGRGGASYRVDLEEVAWLTYSVTRDHLTFDASASLSSGAFVFVGDERLRGEHDNALGRAAPGTISVRRQGMDLDGPTLAHERVHIAQLDYLRIVWGLPLENLLRREWGVPANTWFDHVEVGIGHYPILWVLTAPWPAHATRPLEREAEHIELVRRGGR